MKERLRVLHLCSGNLYGGVETLLVALARYRDVCSDMEPVFTVCFEGRLSQELTAAGVAVHNVGSVRVRNPISVWRARNNLRQFLLHAQVDVVISHSDWTRAILGPVVRDVGIPLVYWLHGSPSGRHWLERWAMRTSSDFAICNSRFTAGLLSGLDPAVPKEVIYNAVPPPETKLSGTARSELRKRFGASDDSVVILQVSRMESLKGHRSHIAALALIKDNPRWICWLVGGPQRPVEQPYFEDLQRLVAQHKLEHRVQFLGPRSDVIHLMAAADIFCQPNEGPESFGMVFVEALWAGLPVVTSAIGGAKEIISNSGCGILIEPKDSVALAGSLGRLIMDDRLRSQMGANGPHHASELCSPDRQISRLSNLLRNSAQKASAA